MNTSHSSVLRFTYFIKTWPVYLLLLPVFFVLHGFNRNYNSVTAADALVLTLLYLGCTLIITGIGWLIYRDLAKSCLIAFFMMAWHFFFGNMQDALKDLSPQTFVSQYRFMLPAGFFLFLALAIWLKRRKRSLQSFISYLNIVLLVCLLIDAARLVVNLSGPPKNRTLNPATVNYTICDTCKKPDIYLLLFDQYAGNTALKEVFNFDNTAFKNELERRGYFFAKNSISNYNLTPFSMASILNMDYLTPEMGVKKNLNVGYCYRMIRKSLVLQLLRENGYLLHNYSVFDFPDQQGKKYGAFFPYGQDLISMQTFTSRLTRDIRSDILHGKFGFRRIQKKIAYEYLYFNDKIFDLTRKIADPQAGSPKFIYSHFIMPHYPYYFDSKGEPVPLGKLTVPKITTSQDYIEYLQYCNSRILELVDHIMKVSPAPPVILLLSDHGFRHPEKEIDRRYDFMNLNAIYIPGKKYSQFSDSVSNVNQFRKVFNTCLGQHFPLLKDSTIDLWD